MVIAIVVVGIVLIGGGSSGKTRAKSTPLATRTVPASAITLTVLNGTEAEGLAHRIAGELRGKGYARAAALDGRPPGANQTTIVEYQPGDRGLAVRVGRAISTSNVKPLEGDVAPLGAGAQVVVIIGANTAAADQ